MIWITTILVALTIALTWAALTAPEGWQDPETGFHYGKRPE